VNFLEDKIGIIIQARMGSARLPGKVLLDLANKPVLQHVVERCQKSNVDEVIVATTTNKKDEKIVEFCKKNNFKFFRGSEEDVLDRYYECAKKFELTQIIRITADCPFVDPTIINKLIKLYNTGKYDYVIIDTNTFPRGFDGEIFSWNILKKIKKNAKIKKEKEHVTIHIRNNKSQYNIASLKNKKNFAYMRLTLDTKEDYKLLKILSSKIENPSFQNIVKYLEANPSLMEINKNIIQKTTKRKNEERFKKYNIGLKNYEVRLLKFRDLLEIKNWRNKKIDILRQNRKLTNDDQVKYWDYLKNSNLEKLFAIEYKKQLQGYFGFVHISENNKSAEISFLLEPAIKENSKKYSLILNKVLLFLIWYGFEISKLNRLFLETYSFRKNHLKVINKSPFIKEAILRESTLKNHKFYDSIVHSIIKKDCEKLNQ